MINFSYKNALSYVSVENKSVQDNIQNSYNQLINKNGKGNDFLGWVNLPQQISDSMFEELEQCASNLQSLAEVVVVIGIGGSYLGARAVIEALQNPFYSLMAQRKNPLVLFAGNSLSEDYHNALLHLLDEKDYALIVISKSGTTTEPAVAFRLLKEHCEKKYGKVDSQKRIVAITDAKRGALKQLSMEENYKTFVIPDDVGGRYSVLTPVGLLPIAVAGFDIRALVAGAAVMRENLFQQSDFENNVAMQYAAVRNILYQNGKRVELMVAYEPALSFFIEWYKQLFGESEGKENKGIFPAGVIFSTDLHSLGQYIQEGERQLFETVISITNSKSRVNIPFDERNIDGLNYLQKKSMTEINHVAEEGTRLAHITGGVPNLQIEVPTISEKYLGELIYFFEFSCAVGGYMLNINPFDQPGVEAYKKNMFRLLGKE